MISSFIQKDTLNSGIQEPRYDCPLMHLSQQLLQNYILGEFRSYGSSVSQKYRGTDDSVKFNRSALCGGGSPRISTSHYFYHEDFHSIQSLRFHISQNMASLRGSSNRICFVKLFSRASRNVGFRLTPPAITFPSQQRWINSSAQNKGPLDGVRILDLTRVLAVRLNSS